MRDSTDLDAVVFSRADQHRLSRHPFQSSDGSIVCAADEMQQPASGVEVPKRDMPCRRGCRENRMAIYENSMRA